MQDAMSGDPSVASVRAEVLLCHPTSCLERSTISIVKHLFVQWW